MVRQHIYIDTSVIGGYCDDEFEEATKKLFSRIEQKDFYIYFSEVNETELILAPQEVQNVKKLIPNDCYKYVELNEEAKQLAEAYIAEKALGQAS